jgi:hypothetical protein
LALALALGLLLSLAPTLLSFLLLPGLQVFLGLLLWGLAFLVTHLGLLQMCDRLHPTQEVPAAQEPVPLPGELAVPALVPLPREQAAQEPVPLLAVLAAVLEPVPLLVVLAVLEPVPAFPLEGTAGHPHQEPLLCQGHRKEARRRNPSKAGHSQSHRDSHSHTRRKWASPSHPSRRPNPSCDRHLCHRD